MPAPSKPAFASGWSSLKDTAASGSAAACVARFCEIFGAARCTSPRDGFFTSWGTTSVEAEAASPAALSAFKELEATCGLRAATVVELAEAELRRFLPSLMGAFELAAGLLGEATSF